MVHFSEEFARATQAQALRKSNVRMLVTYFIVLFKAVLSPKIDRHPGQGSADNVGPAGSPAGGAADVARPKDDVTSTPIPQRF